MPPTPYISRFFFSNDFTEICSYLTPLSAKGISVGIIKALKIIAERIIFFKQFYVVEPTRREI